MKKSLLVILVGLVTIFLVACGGKIVNSSSPSSTPSQTEVPSSSTPTNTPIATESPVITEEPDEEGSKEEGNKEEESSPSLVPSEAASPSPIPSPTELPTPTPLPTSTPTPTVAPTATPIPVAELNIIRKDQFGDDAWFCFTDDNILYVTGTGKLWDRTYFGSDDTLYSVKKIIIEEGITHIGRYTFEGTSNCEEVILPNSLVYVDEFAFMACGGLLWPNGPLIVTNIDKERTEFHPMAFTMSGYDDEEVMKPLPTPTPTPTPIPVPKAEEVDPNNPKMIARVQMGDNAYFEFYDNYEMHVVGSGRTWDKPMGFSWENNWMRDKYPHIPVLSRDYASNLKLCYIGDDITHLGDYNCGGMHFERVSVTANTTAGAGSWLNIAEIRE